MGLKTTIPPKGILQLLNIAGQRMKHKSPGLDIALNDLAQLGYEKEEYYRRNLAFTSTLHSNPEAFKMVVAKFPKLINESNSEHFFSFVADNVKVGNHEAMAEIWTAAAKQTKILGDQLASIQNVLEPVAHKEKFFEAIVSTLNLKDTKSKRYQAL